MHGPVMLIERASQLDLGVGRRLRGLIGKPHVGAKQHGDQAGWRIAAAALRLQGVDVLRGCAKRDQMRHGDLMGDLRAVDVSDGVERARLLKRAAVGCRIRRMGQAAACLHRLAQVVQDDEGGRGHRHHQHAQDQRLALLMDGHHERMCSQFASAALPVKDLSDRALVCAAAFCAACCAARVCVPPSSPASSRAMAAVCERTTCPKY
ncbi:hypothetical protein D3C71_1307290 [compost metagenome]